MKIYVINLREGTCTVKYVWKERKLFGLIERERLSVVRYRWDERKGVWVRVEPLACKYEELFHKLPGEPVTYDHRREPICMFCKHFNECGGDAWRRWVEKVTSLLLTHPELLPQGCVFEPGYVLYHFVKVKPNFPECFEYAGERYPPDRLVEYLRKHSEGLRREVIVEK